MKTRPQFTESAQRTIFNFAVSFILLIGIITILAGCDTVQPDNDPYIALDTTTFYLGIRGDAPFPDEVFRLDTPTFSVDFTKDTATLSTGKLKHWRIIFDGSTVWIYCIANAPDRTTVTFYGTYSSESIQGWAKYGNTIQRATAHRR